MEGRIVAAGAKTVRWRDTAGRNHRHRVVYRAERLAENHANTRLLVEGFNELGPFRVDMGRGEANIVIAEIIEALERWRKLF